MSIAGTDHETRYTTGGESGAFTQQAGMVLSDEQRAQIALMTKSDTDAPAQSEETVFDVDDPYLAKIENTPVSEASPADETAIDPDGEIAASLDEIELELEGGSGLANTKDEEKPKQRLGRRVIDSIIKPAPPIQQGPESVTAPAPAPVKKATPAPTTTSIPVTSAPTPAPSVEVAPRPVPRPPKEKHEIRYVTPKDTEAVPVPERREERKERQPRRDRSRHNPQSSHELHHIHDQMEEAIRKQETDEAYHERELAREAEIRRREEKLAAEIDAEHAAKQLTHEPAEPTTSEETPPQPKKPAFTATEKAWGYSNKRSKKDIDTYMENRPVAQPGDVVRSKDKNGTSIAYQAGTGYRVSKDDYLNTVKADRESTADYYYATQQKEAVNRDHEEALGYNEVFDRNTSEFIRANVEGKLLVEKSLDLTDAYDYGQELKELVNKKVSPEEYKASIEPLLEQKKRIFGILYAKLEADNADQRALDFITYDINVDVTVDSNGKATVEIEDRTEPSGVAYFEGQKVIVLDFIENPDGKKAYTIQLEDGSTQTVYAQDVEFKREYSKPEVETEQLSRGERLKRWMKAEVGAIRNLSGKEYFAGAMSRVGGHVGSWLRSHRVDEATMTQEQKDEQRKKNRRSAMLGGAVIAFGAYMAVRYGNDIFSMAPDGSELSNLPHGAGGGDLMPPLLPPEAPAPHESLSEQLKDILEGVGEAHYTTPTPEISTEALNNVAYNIPSGGRGYDLFDSLHIDRSLWDQNASELAERFPREFYWENGDLRIMNKGWLSEDVRKFIEGLRAKGA